MTKMTLGLATEVPGVIGGGSSMMAHTGDRSFEEKKVSIVGVTGDCDPNTLPGDDRGAVVVS